MLFQSIGQMREIYGGCDVASKWLESAFWMAFSAMNDPETAEYISRRCGDTTVDVSQISRSSQASGLSQTRDLFAAQGHDRLSPATDSRPRAGGNRHSSTAGESTDATERDVTGREEKRIGRQRMTPARGF